jgi:hypothetical protein
MDMTLLVDPAGARAQAADASGLVAVDDNRRYAEFVTEAIRDFLTRS